MKENSWLELIAYIFNFFFNRKKLNAQKKAKEKERLNNELEDKYNRIDKKKNKNKKKDVKKRLDNMF